MFDQDELTRLVARLYKTDTCWYLTKTSHRTLQTGTTILYNGKRVAMPIHKLMYLAYKGDIPKGDRHYVIRHLCGNGGCCNPEHLAIGTQRENAFDAQFHAKYGRGVLAPEFYD